MRGALAAVLALLADPVQADCRQALAIGMDISGSVDQQEYLLQQHGLADALADPEVAALLLASPAQTVRLTVYDWSGSGDQRVILPWTDLTDAGALAAAVTRIRGAARGARSAGTAVGEAMLFGDALLATQADCARHTLDLSGDGLNNAGPQPGAVAIGGPVRTVTVNALVIGVEGEAGWDGGDPGLAELTGWFRQNVIRGPGAFVETARGFEDFRSAMQRKLVREIEGVTIGFAAPPSRGGLDSPPVMPVQGAGPSHL